MDKRMWNGSERLRELEQSSDALNLAGVIDRLMESKVGSRDGRARRVAMLLYMAWRKGETPAWARGQRVAPREFCVTYAELDRVTGGQLGHSFAEWLESEGIVIRVGSLTYFDGCEIPLRMFAWDKD